MTGNPSRTCARRSGAKARCKPKNSRGVGNCLGIGSNSTLQDSGHGRRFNTPAIRFRGCTPSCRPAPLAVLMLRCAPARTPRSEGAGGIANDRDGSPRRTRASREGVDSVSPIPLRRDVSNSLRRDVGDGLVWDSAPARARPGPVVFLRPGRAGLTCRRNGTGCALKHVRKIDKTCSTDLEVSCRGAGAAGADTSRVFGSNAASRERTETGLCYAPAASLAESDPPPDEGRAE